MDLTKLDKSLMTNIEIDLTTSCNLRCRLCSSAGMVVGPQKELNVDIVRKIFRDIKHPCIVNLLGGEPFVYLTDKQDLYDDLFSNEYILPKFTTNGILLKKQMKLLDYMKYKSWQINFSIDGYGDVYEHLRVGAKWEDAIESIKLANNLRLSNKDRTYITIQYIATQDTIKQLPDFMLIAADAGADQVGVLHLLYSQSAYNAYHTDFKNYIIDDIDIYKHYLREAVNKVKKENLNINFASKTIEGESFSCLNNPRYLDFNQFSKKREVYDNYFCKQALIFVINPDGAITPCCGGRNLVMGNCNIDSIYDIWNGSNFQQLRSDLLLDVKPSYCNCTEIHASKDFVGASSSYREDVLIKKYNSYIEEFNRIKEANIDDAILYLEAKEKEVFDFDTNSIMIWNNLAGVYLYRKQDYLNSKKYCQKILNIKPDSEEALIKMANIQIFTKEVDSAIDILTQLDTKNILKFFWLGYAYEQKKDYCRMLVQYKRYIDLETAVNIWGYKHASEMVNQCS